MNRLICVGFCLLFLVIGSTADAQFVRVGPYGGVSIRAPFFAMDIPGPPIPPPFMFRARRPVVVAAPYPAYAYPQVQIEYADPGGIASPRHTVNRAFSPPTNMAELESQLWEAASQLARSLVSQRDAEMWTNYLAPDRIVAAIEQGNRGSVARLTDHYDGVTANPQLAWLTRLDGFAATRSLLHQYVGSRRVPVPAQSSQQRASETRPQVQRTPSLEDRPLIEQADPVPLPAPTPLPDPLPADGASSNPPTSGAALSTDEGSSILGE